LRSIFAAPVKRIQALQGELGGSGRKIIRLSNEAATAIGVLYGVREENVAFLEFSRHFRQHGLPCGDLRRRSEFRRLPREDLGIRPFSSSCRKPEGESITQMLLKRIAKLSQCCRDFRWKLAGLEL